MANSNLKRSFTADEAREAFTYDPEVGVLAWRKTGIRAGRVHRNGYFEVGFRRGHYNAHRIIWLIMTGEFPTYQVDHVNGVKDDNRWSNLREATVAEQGQNRPLQSNNTSGVTGVHFNKSTGTWNAYIRVNRKRIYLGKAATRDEAHALYLAGKKSLHKFEPIPMEMRNDA